MRHSKEKIEAARAAMENAAKVLAVHSAEWKEEFYGAINPFVAVNVYMSDRERKRRAAITNPWLKARDYYYSIKKKTTK